MVMKLTRNQIRKWEESIDASEKYESVIHPQSPSHNEFIMMKDRQSYIDAVLSDHNRECYVEFTEIYGDMEPCDLCG